MMRRSRRALSIGLPILAVGSLVFLVGWFWFGWGYVAANRDLLRSLPVPRDAELLEVGISRLSHRRVAYAPP